MFKKILIICDEATTICDKNQYGEASTWEKMKLMFHVLSCKICALYLKQNKMMTKVFKIKSKECKKLSEFCLSKEEKENLKSELKKIKV